MAIITPHGHGLGWRRDLPDHRDFTFAAPADVLTTLPTSVDLRPIMPAVYDQGPIGSCTANAIAGAIQFDRLKNNEPPDFIPSRLFVYWNERYMEHDVPLDAGAELRDGIKSVARWGAPPENDWPYVPTPADPSTNLFPAGSAPVTKPSATAYADAKKHIAISYYRVQQTLTQIKGCLAQGYPFVFGFAVYSSIYDSNGNPVAYLPMPTVDDQILGGHAVMAVGYQDSNNMFIVRNSWGPTVQLNGYFFMPYAYLLDSNLASDMWTIRRMSA
jgi:C1A family cysteine protease